MEYEEAWKLIKKGFPILSEPIEELHIEVPQDVWLHITEFVTKLGVGQIVQELVISRIEKHMRLVVTPKFWSYFIQIDTKYNGFESFYKAVDFLYGNTSKYIQVGLQLKTLQDNNSVFRLHGETDIIESLKVIVRATLFSQLPIEHSKIIGEFYETGLKMEDGEGYFEDKLCTLCNQQRSDCQCLDKFYESNRALVVLGLLEPLVGQILTSLIYAHVDNYIQKICKDNFDRSFISTLEEWLENSIIKWLGRVHFLYLSDSSDMREYMSSFRQKLTNFLFETYTKLRINQFFNMIIEYPDSLPALEDLRTCFIKTDLRSLLIKKLQRAMETRLLHPGVSTPDILTAYVASIRSLRVLDPSGLLLETVTQPVHLYLRSREDTVRCVVSSLTEEGSNELAEELIKGDLVNIDENNVSDEDSENWENWMPAPVDVYPNKPEHTRRTADIISMLVNVYGSKELFVNEYRTLLADRLLSQFTCDTQKEIRYLELLKLRFGDSQLHYCEVMLKDVTDSKRINQNISQDPNYNADSFPMSAMIVSAQFWPPFKDEKLELHKKVADKLENYTQGFQVLKGNRTLSWKNHLGVVDIEIEIQDRVTNLSVSPVHATILMHFQDKDEWDLEDLSSVMHVPPTMLRRKLGFWQSHGLIEESELNIFHLVETESKMSPGNPEDVEEYESESAMASTQDQREEELQTCWSYIVGMLMNLETLPLERIHQMLKMFAYQGPTIECTVEELRHFLDRKVREHRLVYTNGVYKLPKTDIL